MFAASRELAATSRIEPTVATTTTLVAPLTDSSGRPPREVEPSLVPDRLNTPLSRSKQTVTPRARLLPPYDRQLSSVLGASRHSCRAPSGGYHGALFLVLGGLGFQALQVP